MRDTLTPAQKDEQRRHDESLNWFTLKILLGFSLMALLVGAYELDAYLDNLPGKPITPSAQLATKLGTDVDQSSIRDVTPRGTPRKHGRTLTFKVRGTPDVYSAHSTDGLMTIYNPEGEVIRHWPRHINDR